MGEEGIIGAVPTSKPFVQVACVCEKVLREHDSVPSLIRVVDTYNVEPLHAELPLGLKAALPLTIFVGLKSGDVVGEHAVGIRLVKPDGTLGPLREWPMMFNGGEHGANLQVGFALEAQEFGLFWFDVLWAGEVLTRIPLRVQLKASAASDKPNESELSQPHSSSA